MGISLSILGVPGVVSAGALLLHDTFTDANGTSLDAHTAAPIVPTGGAWNEEVGDWTITTNEAMNDGTASSLAFLDLGRVAKRVWASVKVNGDSGVIIRGLAGVNDTGFLVELRSGLDLCRIFELDSGATLRDSTAFTVNTSLYYDIEARDDDGTDIVGLVDGAALVSYVSGNFNTQTECGLSRGTTNARWAWIKAL